MATQVEGKPATLLSDSPNETKSPRTHMSPLSDASNKAFEPSCPLILENDNKLSRTFSFLTRPTAGPKPRLSPKPFSLEPSAFYETGGKMKPPFIDPLPISLGSKSLLPEKLTGESGIRHTAAKSVPSGTVSSLLSSFGQRTSSGSDASHFFRPLDSQDKEETLLLKSYSSPKSMVVSRSETGGLAEQKDEQPKSEPIALVILEKSDVQRLKSKQPSEWEKESGQRTRGDSPLDQESQGTPRSLILSRPSALSRKHSPSTSQGPGTSKYPSKAASLAFLGMSERVTEEDKGKTDKETDANEIPVPSRTGMRKSRPLATWLPGTTNDQKSVSPPETIVNLDDKTGSVRHEKTWLKKPRPLPMDLTARFEAVGPGGHRKTVALSEDSKENVPVVKSTSGLASDSRREVRELMLQQEEPPGETDKWAVTPLNDRRDSDAQNCTGKKKLTNVPKTENNAKDTKGLRLNGREDPEKLTSREEIFGFENDLKIPADVRDKLEESTTSFKADIDMLRTDQQMTWTRREPEKESSSHEREDEGSSFSSDDRRKREGSRTPGSGGIIKSRISLLLDSASSPPKTSDSPQTGSEKEKLNIGIRKRIQTFAVEKSEAKIDERRASQRRSFQPRPLSTGITKRFLTEAADEDDEKQMERANSTYQEHPASSRPERERAREKPGKRNQAQTEPLHTLDPYEEFVWRRRGSVGGMSRGIGDEKMTPEKMGVKSSFTRERERRGDGLDRDIPFTVVSVSRVDTDCSEQKPASSWTSDSDSSVKAVRVSLIDNHIERHKVPEPQRSEPALPSLHSDADQNRGTGRDIHSRVKAHTSEKATEVKRRERESHKERLSESDAAPVERKKGPIIEEKCAVQVSEERHAQAPQPKVSDLLSLMNVGEIEAKVDILQTLSEKAISCSLPTCEDKAIPLRSRRSRPPVEQSHNEDLSDRRRPLKFLLHAEPITILEKNTEVKPDPIGTGQRKREDVRTVNPVSDSGRSRLEKTSLGSHSGLDVGASSGPKEIPRGEEVLGASGLFITKGGKDIEMWKEPQVSLSGDGTTKLGVPREGAERRTRKKSPSSESRSTIFAVTGQMAEYMAEAQPRAAKRADDLFAIASRPGERRRDNYPEENSVKSIEKSPKLASREGTRKTLLSEEFLDRDEAGSEDAAVVLRVPRASKRTETSEPQDKVRKTRSAKDRHRHTVVDLDALMMEYRKEKTKQEEAMRSRPSQTKDDLYQRDWEKPGSQRLGSNREQSQKVSFSSDQQNDGSATLRDRDPQRNKVLDLDVLMVAYRKEGLNLKERAGQSGEARLAEDEKALPIARKISPSTSGEMKSFARTQRSRKRLEEESKDDSSLGTSGDQEAKSERRRGRLPSAFPEAKVQQEESGETEVHVGGRKPEPNHTRAKHREEERNERAARARRSEHRSDILHRESKPEIPLIETSSQEVHWPDTKPSPLDCLLAPGSKPSHSLPGSGRGINGSSQLDSNWRCVEIDYRSVESKESLSYSDENLLPIHLPHPEIRKTRPVEIGQRTTDSPSTRQQEALDIERGWGARSCSPSKGTNQVTDVLFRAMKTTSQNKKEESRAVDWVPPETVRTQSPRRRLEDMLQAVARPRRRIEEETPSWRKKQEPEQIREFCTGVPAAARDTDDLVQDQTLYHSFEDEPQPLDRCSLTSPYADPGVEQASTYAEPSTSPFVLPARPAEHSRLPSHSEGNGGNERRGSFRGQRSSSLDHSSNEYESLEDTDSSQSAGVGAPIEHKPEFSFLEHVAVLDNVAQKSRIQLGKKSIRRPPGARTSRRQRLISGDAQMSPDQNNGDWMFKDSTEPQLVRQEESEEEEIRPRPIPVMQSPRVPMFPGMDPSALKARLRRSRPKEEETMETSTVQQSRSLHGPAGVRVLPPPPGKDEGSEEASPSWLRELKSKKRFSQNQHCPPDWNNQ
eukprot:gi/632967670/ref/XP_007900106.1/ PREDICTED: microtubule-associated protein futsch-like [Callorhinchus milii]